MKYDSDYSIRLKTLEQMGGDVTKKYDSVYSIDLEILRLMEEGGGGGGGTSDKVVRISKDWYNNQDNYQTEIKKALDDIYNEVSNNRSVTVVFDGFGSQADNWIFETSNVVALNKDDVLAYGLGWDKTLLQLRLRYYEGSNHSSLEREDIKLASKGEFYVPYVYRDRQVRMDSEVHHNRGVSEFISEPTVDNEEFVVLKTTVQAYSDTTDPNFYVYFALDDNGYFYYVSKFGGMRLNQVDYEAHYDLIPDGEWYVIFYDISAVTYKKCLVTKSVRNVDGSLDVYLGFKGYNLDNLSFYDCTVQNRLVQGEPGKWNEKNWVKVSDAQNISVDSFIAIPTRYFCTNTEGVKVNSLRLFKRLK